MNIDELVEDFALLDDWEERYRYVIELGKSLEPLDEELHTPENKVQGCVSQVWLVTRTARNADGQPVLTFAGDSDAHIVRGLIAILFAMYGGRTPEEILAMDEKEIFHRIGLDDHLSPQRSNGLYAMVARIKADAETARQGAGAEPQPILH